MAKRRLNIQHIFSSLVSELNELLDGEVIITNEEGIIMASTDPKRIGAFHEGAKLVMEKRYKMNMTEKLTEELEGVRKGILLPIIIHNEPIAVLGITGEPHVVEPQAQLVKKVAELFIQDTMHQMNQEKQARDLDFFVFDWLYQIMEPSDLIQRANFFKINMNAYQQVILFKTEETDLNLSYQDLSLLRMMWDQKGDGLFARWGEGKWLLLLKKLPEKNLAYRLEQFIKDVDQQMDMRVFAGCGQVVSERELYHSFEQASRAVKIANSNNPLVFEEAMRLEMILSELTEETKDKFIKRTIYPLEKETFLLNTLQAWFDQGMSNGKAATQLHVHKNTLNYRLKRVEELTGLKLYQIEDLVMLYLGYQFLMKQ